MIYFCRICHGTKYSVVTKGIEDWELGVAGVYDYVRCSYCQQVSISPFPTLADLIKAYPDTYTAFSQSPQKRGRVYQILQKILNRQKFNSYKPFLNSNSKVLDVGCGNGRFLAQLREASLAKEIHGIDFHPLACELSRLQGVDVFQGTFMEFKSSIHFDAIFMINYIEHVLDPVAEVKKAFSQLGPQGILTGELPNYESIDRLLFGKYWGGNHIPRHTFQFGPENLRKLLASAGFKNIYIKQEINPGHLALSIQNLFVALGAAKPENGRSKYFTVLLLLCAPINLVFKLLGRSGTMTFQASK